MTYRVYIRNGDEVEVSGVKAVNEKSASSIAFLGENDRVIARFYLDEIIGWVLVGFGRRSPEVG